MIITSIQAFKNVIEEVGNYAACSTGQTVVALEELVLSKVLTMRVGTLEDRQEGAESRCEITGVAIYLVAISRWPSMRKDRDRFLRVADGLARYSLLPDLSKTDAKRLADRIDDYLKYGTNKPPFKAGVARKWNGPVSEHVYKTAHFRELYNSSVMEMRRRVIGVYERVIFEDGFRQISEIDRQNLWKEFLVRAGEKVD